MNTINHKPLLNRLLAGKDLSSGEMEAFIGAVMDGGVEDAVIAAMLIALRAKTETGVEVAAAARAMRARSLAVEIADPQLAVDTCGTGGDGASTFNISTTVALVVAACGVPVAKHGNRAISSKSGSADVLEELGVKLDIAPEKVAECIDSIGIGFLFAPGHHPAMRHAAAPRRELGMRSIFNLLGPLTNPAGAEYQVLGVFARDKLDLVAGALHELGVNRALIVHGRDGLDEITTTGITDAVWVEKGAPLRPFEIDPAAFGMPYANSDELAGGCARRNASILLDILKGQHGAPRDIVLLNAATALWVAGHVDGIAQGLRQAAEAIDSGQAKAKLDELIAFTQAAGNA